MIKLLLAASLIRGGIHFTSGAPAASVRECLRRTISVRCNKRSPFPIISLCGIDPAGVITCGLPVPSDLSRVRLLRQPTHHIIVDVLSLVTAYAAGVKSSFAHHSICPVKLRIGVGL